MPPNEPQQPQGSNNNQDNAPAAEQQPGNIAGSSGLNPNIAPWTPSSTLSDIPTMPEQPRPAPIVPILFHYQQEVPQMPGYNTANNQAAGPFNPRNLAPQQSSFRHGHGSEQVEPLYRSMYGPNGLAIPREASPFVPGPFGTDGQNVILGRGRPSGYPPPIRAPGPVPVTMNPLNGPSNFVGFSPAFNHHLPMGYPGSAGAAAFYHPVTQVGDAAGRVSNPLFTPVMPTNRGPAGQILPAPHSFPRVNQPGQLVASRSAGTLNLDTSPTPTRALPAQVVSSVDDTRVVANQQPSGLNLADPDNAWIQQAIDADHLTPELMQLLTTVDTPSTYDLDFHLATLDLPVAAVDLAQANVGPSQDNSSMMNFTTRDVAPANPAAGATGFIAEPQSEDPAPLGLTISQRAPNSIRSRRSAALNALTDTPTGLPDITTALASENFPFVTSAEAPQGHNGGVIKLSNIPFSATRSEVIAFLGRNSRILNDVEEPVHIMMDRVSSKTNDAYIEFQTMADAVACIDRFLLGFSKGKVARLGDRPVSINLSSQTALMEDLFPFANGVRWEGIKPRMLGPRTDGAKYGRFEGFVTEEEMIMLVKHVEMPNRSPFARDCPQRPFESLISTLKKLPWHCHDYITLRQRAAIHRATVELLRILCSKVRDRVDEVNLTSGLQRRLVATAMMCPGFTPLQKDDIAYIVGMDDMESRAYNQPRHPDSWRHLYALSPKPGVPLDMLEWYIALIREETTRAVATLPLRRRTDLEKIAQGTDNYFGFLWAELLRPFGGEVDQMTLGVCARAEMMAIEHILYRALGR
ncbi:hypothetical protein ACHAQA_007621 [Verticillium albo-atrum]